MVDERDLRKFNDSLGSLMSEFTKKTGVLISNIETRIRLNRTGDTTFIIHYDIETEYSEIPRGAV